MSVTEYHRQVYGTVGRVIPGIEVGIQVRDWDVDVVLLAAVASPILEAFYGLRCRRGIPVVGTIMSMSVAPFVARTVPLIVGTERIREAALRAVTAGSRCWSRPSTRGGPSLG